MRLKTTAILYSQTPRLNGVAGKLSIRLFLHQFVLTAMAVPILSEGGFVQRYRYKNQYLSRLINVKRHFL